MSMQGGGTAYAGQARLTLTASAISDTNGVLSAAVFAGKGAAMRLGPVEQGYVYQGTLQVPNAPSGAAFTASVLGTQVGQWAGPTNFGLIQMWGGEYVSVAATGLQPSTPYTLQFVGVSIPEAVAVPIPPAAPISTVTVETSTLLISAFRFTAANAAAGITFTPPTLTRRISVIIDARNIVTTPVEVDILGTVTNTLYFGVQPNAGTNANPPYFGEVEPAVDPSYKLFMSQAPSGADSLLVWVLASLTNPMVASDPSSPLQVAGSQSVLALPVKSEITKIDANANWSGTATAPLATTGGPVGPFNKYFNSNLTTGNNQQVIAAPGAGFSIYLQSLWTASNGAVANNFAQFHPAGTSSQIALMTYPGVDFSQQFTFPGGFELPANTALQADIGAPAGGIAVGGTYVIGPTI